MLKSYRLALLFVSALTFAACSSGVRSGQAVGQYTNPVVRPVAADPSLIKAQDGRYYLYATADNAGDGYRVIPIYVSDDLVNWSFAGTVFKERPSWKEKGGVWAPDISYDRGTYSIYYAYSTWGDPNPCIGLATAKSPMGPWTDLGRAVFCSEDIGVKNSIDAFAWNEKGKRTLIWGSFNGIYAVGMSPDGTRASGEKVRIADNRFEAPFVLRRNGYYYLFVSAGTCCEGDKSTYHVIIGRSKSLTGPYLDRAGKDLNAGGGTLILKGNGGWAGPGHNAIVTDDAGQAWIVYHAMPRNSARFENGTNRREALIDPITWTSDGWPEIEGGVPSSGPQQAPIVRKK